jgi:hypothetical protein
MFVSKESRELGLELGELGPDGRQLKTLQEKVIDAEQGPLSI